MLTVARILGYQLELSYVPTDTLRLYRSFASLLTLSASYFYVLGKL